MFYAFFILTKSGGSIFMFTSKTDLCNTLLTEAKVGMATSALMAEGSQAKDMGFHPKPSHLMCVHYDRETNNFIYGTVAWSGRTGLNRLKEPRQNLETRIRLRRGWGGGGRFRSCTTAEP